jgi:integrase
MWEFRFYDTDLDGSRNRKSLDIGPVSEFPSESAVRKSPVLQPLLLRINSNQRTSLPDFGAVIARYEQEEMPQRYSTSVAYKSYIKNHIHPRWAAVPIHAVKTMAVEDWLKKLALAPKSKSHIRSLMHTLFRCAQRWELTDKNPIELVRVKGGK